MNSYEVFCHGCGTVHTVQAYFLFTPTIVCPDGVTRGMYNCGCNKHGKAYRALQEGGDTWARYKDANWKDRNAT